MVHYVYNDMMDTEFTDEEMTEIETIKKATGLNWHDFILDAARLYSR